MSKIKFIRAEPSSMKKYSAFIPRDIWNKYYPDKPINRPHKRVSFGSLPYQHYEDKIGHYSHLNHYDENRRKNYYKRFGKKADVFTPKWFSHNYLW